MALAPVASQLPPPGAFVNAPPPQPAGPPVGPPIGAPPLQVMYPYGAPRMQQPPGRYQPDAMQGCSLCVHVYEFASLC